MNRVGPLRRCKWIDPENSWRDWEGERIPALLCWRKEEGMCADAAAW